MQYLQRTLFLLKKDKFSRYLGGNDQFLKQDGSLKSVEINDLSDIREFDGSDFKLDFFLLNDKEEFIIKNQLGDC